MGKNVYQIYYREDQIPHMCEAFRPYPNFSAEPPEWREYSVFLENYKNGKIAKEGYTGFVSWKFERKTKIFGAQFLQFIDAHPGYDVYFINPYPFLAEQFKNVWLQGESVHSGILPFAQNAFRKLGKKINLLEMENGETTAAYCNFWVGSPLFWEEYIRFTEPFFSYINEHLFEEGGALSKPVPGKGGVSMKPFLMERAFSTLLVTNKNIKACAYRYSKSELSKKFFELQKAHNFLTEELRALREKQEIPSPHQPAIAGSFAPPPGTEIPSPIDPTEPNAEQVGQSLARHPILLRWVRWVISLADFFSYRR